MIRNENKANNKVKLIQFFMNAKILYKPSYKF